MVDKDKPQVPVDDDGKPLVKLTPEQYARKLEIEYERLIKTSNKGIYNKWSREEKHMLISWAHSNNYETSRAEFKDIVEAFIEYNPLKGNRILHSLPRLDNSGRDIEVLCRFCARIHTFDAPVAYRGVWTFDAPCVLSRKPENGKLTVIDETPISRWEFKWIEAKESNEKN